MDNRFRFRQAGGRVETTPKTDDMHNLPEQGPLTQIEEWLHPDIDKVVAEIERETLELSLSGRLRPFVELSAPPYDRPKDEIAHEDGPIRRRRGMGEMLGKVQRRRHEKKRVMTREWPEKNRLMEERRAEMLALRKANDAEMKRRLA